MKLKKIMLGVLLFAFSLYTVAAEGKIKVAHYFGDSHPQNIALKEKFKPYVEEHTNYIVEIYPNAILGSEEEVSQGVRAGIIEMTVAGMILQTTKPKLGIIEWPFLFGNYQEAKHILDGEIGQEIAEEFISLGLMPLVWNANGFRVLSSNRPVLSMDDFKGLRLRMPNAEVYIETGKALGANIQGAPISEVFTALEQGVFDAQENPYATLKESAFYEVQSHVLESNHLFSPNIYLINKKLYDGMSEEDQNAIREAARIAADYEWGLLENGDDSIKEFLTAEGLTITIPSDEFKEQLRLAMEPVYNKIFKKYDWAEDFYNRIQAELETFRANK